MKKWKESAPQFLVVVQPMQEISRFHLQWLHYYRTRQTLVASTFDRLSCCYPEMLPHHHADKHHVSSGMIKQFMKGTDDRSR